MLILSRRPGEAIIIGDELRLEVREISGRSATISFTALDGGEDLLPEVPDVRLDLEESISLADGNVMVKLTAVRKGPSIRLGLDADRSIRIFREEAYTKRKAAVPGSGVLDAIPN